MLDMIFNAVELSKNGEAMSLHGLLDSEKEFEKIADVTVLEDGVTEIYIDKDTNGKDFAIDQYSIDIVAPTSQMTSYAAVWANGKYDAEILNAFRNNASSTSSSFARLKFGSKTISFSVNGSNNNTTMSVVQSFASFLKDVSEIRNFRIKCSYSANYVIPVGTNIKIYGTRA